jgi:hypothetical protein
MAVAETMRKIRAHWRAQLGCDVDALPRGVTVIVHAAALAAYSGPYAVMREDRCVVSAPVWIVDRAHDALAGRAAADVFDAHAIAVPFGDAVERVIGPAWIGYADAADVRAPDARDARLLTSDDVAALRALSAAAGETAWQHSGIDFDRAPIFGLFVHDVLAAACSYERRGERVLHVGVVRIRPIVAAATGALWQALLRRTGWRRAGSCSGRRSSRTHRRSRSAVAGIPGVLPDARGAVAG